MPFTCQNYLSMYLQFEFGLIHDGLIVQNSLFNRSLQSLPLESALRVSTCLWDFYSNAFIDI